MGDSGESPKATATARTAPVSTAANGPRRLANVDAVDRLVGAQRAVVDEGEAEQDEAEADQQGEVAAR